MEKPKWTFWPTQYYYYFPSCSAVLPESLNDNWSINLASTFLPGPSVKVKETGSGWEEICDEWTSEEGGVILLFSPETWEGALQTFPRNEGSKEMGQMKTFRDASATLSLHTAPSEDKIHQKSKRVVSVGVTNSSYLEEEGSSLRQEEPGRRSKGASGFQLLWGSFRVSLRTGGSENSLR